MFSLRCLRVLESLALSLALTSKELCKTRAQDKGSHFSLPLSTCSEKDLDCCCGLDDLLVPRLRVLKLNPCGEVLGRVDTKSTSNV